MVDPVLHPKSERLSRGWCRGVRRRHRAGQVAHVLATRPEEEPTAAATQLERLRPCPYHAVNRLRPTRQRYPEPFPQAHAELTDPITTAQFTPCAAARRRGGPPSCRRRRHHSLRRAPSSRASASCRLHKRREARRVKGALATVPLPLEVGSRRDVFYAVVPARSHVGPPEVKRLLHHGREVVAVVDDHVHTACREADLAHGGLAL